MGVYNQINGRLGNAKRSIKVLSIASEHGGLYLVTDAIPDKDDLSIFTTLLETELKKKAPETELRVKIPTSKSCLKINDFSTFRLSPKCDEKTGRLIPLTTEQIAAILAKAPFTKDFHYYENSGPCTSSNSARSDTCTVWFDIADLHAGLNLCNLVGRNFMYGKHCLVVSPADCRSGVLQCNRCWRFGHRSDTCVCPLKGKICPICSETHTLKFHRALALCCQGQLKHNPPIPATPEGEDCFHAGKCVNCHGDHRSDDRKCKYWQKRFDGEWIFKRYKKQGVRDDFLHCFFHSDTNSLPAGQRARHIPQGFP